MAGHSTKSATPATLITTTSSTRAATGPGTDPGTKYSPKHSRIRISRRATVAIGTLAVGGLVLAPTVANADPKPTVEQVKAQLDTLYRQAASANEQYNAAEDAEKQLQGQIAGVNAKIAQDELAMEGAKSRLGSIAASQYRSGGSVDPTMQLLLQADPKKLLDMAGTADRASAVNATALVDVTQAKASLDIERKDASAKLATLDRTTKDAAAKKKSFDDSVAKTQTLLNGLQAEQRAQLAVLQAQQRATLQAQQAALTAQLSTASTSTSSSSSSSTPSPGSSPTSTSTPAPKPTSPTPGGGSTTVPANGRAAAAVAFARAQLGKPYVFGATGPHSYDCSGLTQAAWSSAGVSIPRTATAQMKSMTAVSLSAAQPGDLVFFYGNSSYVDHVGIYIGGGTVIHAPQPGSVVETLSVSSMPFVSVGRP